MAKRRQMSVLALVAGLSGLITFSTTKMVTNITSPPATITVLDSMSMAEWLEHHTSSGLDVSGIEALAIIDGFARQIETHIDSVTGVRARAVTLAVDDFVGPIDKRVGELGRDLAALSRKIILLTQKIDEQKSVVYVYLDDRLIAVRPEDVDEDGWLIIPGTEIRIAPWPKD